MWQKDDLINTKITPFELITGTSNAKSSAKIVQQDHKFVWNYMELQKVQPEGKHIPQISLM